jgi:hypothetical protein
MLNASDRGPDASPRPCRCLQPPPSQRSSAARLGTIRYTYIPAAVTTKGQPEPSRCNALSFDRLDARPHYTKAEHVQPPGAQLCHVLLSK